MATRLTQEMTDQAVRSAVRAVRQEACGRPDNGWRGGKPIEDPEKTKRWGFVTAKPSEYLVHMRRGKILGRSSGQGASCFKWPWDSVAIIPTTLQHIYFAADQVTSEKVGVQVKGLAVYRVARPELTVRMLNFSFPERAQQKLAETLGDMFIGAVRRLVANLTVEECLVRRKEALAAFLMAEIAPVVSGAGRASDSTDRGWGVVIDTIEIQDVVVLSEAVFANMQAPYRNQLMLKAREAELARERELEETQARADAQLRELRAQAETAAAQAESAAQMKRLAAQTQAEQARVQAERELEHAKLEADRELERRKLEKEAELSRARAEKDREAQAYRARGEAEARKVKAEASAHAAEAEALAGERAQELRAQSAHNQLSREHELAKTKLAHQTEQARERAMAEREAAEAEDALVAERAQRALELQKSEAASSAEVRRLEMELTRLEGELKASVAARQREVDNTISLEKLQSDFVNKALPEIAHVLQQQFSKVEIIAGANENPFGFLVHAFEGVMEMARWGGLSSAVTTPGALTRPPARANGAHPVVEKKPS